ncbi:hypothetical protein GJV52_00890 [Neisseria brasiliensis]|nr:MULTISPECIES: hypothetical protein [Neisseria]QGL24234.1 hypothetical protein GJV52_00890 [Neisseria brasiliensis]
MCEQKENRPKSGGSGKRNQALRQSLAEIKRIAQGLTLEDLAKIGR